MVMIQNEVLIWGKTKSCLLLNPHNSGKKSLLQRIVGGLFWGRGPHGYSGLGAPSVSMDPRPCLVTLSDPKSRALLFFYFISNC